jgi:ankyrin repeat protein
MCQLKELTNCRGPADLRQALARMPKGLNDTYAQMISRILDDDYEVAMRMLYWLLFSVRPLQIEELAELVAMDLNSDSFDSIEHLWDPNDVLDICPGLMTTIEERSDASEEEPKILVRLAHISIREYLLSSDILSGKVAQFHVEESAAHASIAKCSLMYMRFPKGPLPDAFDGLPLGVYAAENWLYHYEQVPETATEIHHLCLDFFLNRKSVFFNWMAYYSTLTPPRFNISLLDIINLSPLYIASAYGLLPVLKLMLASDEIDMRGDALLPNALRAADRGTWPPKENVRLRTVKFLLKHGADFSGEGRFASTLHGASYFGFDDVVKSELDDGFEVNTLGGDYGSALQAAVVGRWERNYHEIMKTRRLKSSTQGSFDGISLETVRILLQRGANPNIWDGEKGSALFISCSNGDLSCAKLLLDSAADPNYRLKKKNGRWAGSCVSAATGSGDIRLLQLLFDHGATTNCAFALSATALVSDINIMRLLLDKGVDPNAVTEYDDETPLQKICSFCPPETVELLLKYGANPNLGGGRMGSPLQSTCAAYGSVESLKLLISYGANVNQICGAFGTALHAAAFYGDFVMVEYLVSQGADIHAKGYMYPSVVRCALQNGHGSIVCFLLKLGADMDTHGGRYGETLQRLLAMAPADEPELWFQTYAKSNSLQLCVMIKKGKTWQDFDNIELEDRDGNGVHVEDSKWACILPPAVQIRA